MRKESRPKLRVPKPPRRDLAGPAYRRFARMNIMRPDDTLFLAGVALSGAVFAWLVAGL
jgi:hypothetical protein